MEEETKKEIRYIWSMLFMLIGVVIILIIAVGRLLGATTTLKESIGLLIGSVVFVYGVARVEVSAFKAMLVFLKNKGLLK